MRNLRVPQVAVPRDLCEALAIREAIPSRRDKYADVRHPYFSETLYGSAIAFDQRPPRSMPIATRQSDTSPSVSRRRRMPSRPVAAPVKSNVAVGSGTGWASAL